jgi:hypothetical protein
MPIRKATWLYFRGIESTEIRIPFRLHARGADKRKWQQQSRHQASSTALPFAEWLVALARKVKL